MKCREASHLISLSMEKKLPLFQRVGLRFHLFICNACTNFCLQLRLLRKAMQVLARAWETDPALKLSEDARKRIVEAIDGKHSD